MGGTDKCVCPCLIRMGSHERFTTEKSHITCEILAYLAEHPDAQDTLEGIAAWWLLEQKIKHTTVEVEKSLAELMDKGFIVECDGKDLHTYYRINRKKYEEIKAINNKQKQHDNGKP